MITIALYNLKGGVGKTTSAVNLAYLAAAAGKSTVLWDWDPQAAASWYCGVDADKTKAIRVISDGVPVGLMQKGTPYPNLTLVPADLSLRKVDSELDAIDAPKKLLRNLVSALGEEASLLVFDCPPTISPSMEYLMGAVDMLLVPMIPSPLSTRAMAQIQAFFAGKKRAPKNIYGFFNMVDLRRSLHKETLLSAQGLPIQMLHTHVPMDSAAERMSVLRQPLTSYARTGKAAQAYRDIWREISVILRHG